MITRVSARYKARRAWWSSISRMTRIFALYPRLTSPIQNEQSIHSGVLTWLPGRPNSRRSRRYGMRLD